MFFLPEFDIIVKIFVCLGEKIMKDMQWLFSKPIAHRGLHNAELPENSLGAFENAIQNGYPIELDVRLTDDGKVVVFHDDALSRMTGKDGYVSKISSDALNEYKLLDGEKKPSTYCIPTFEETLSVVAGRVPLLIEIKNSGSVGPLEKKVTSILSSYTGKFAVQSFNPLSIQYFKDNMPDVPRGVLSCFFTKKDVKGFIKRRLLKTLALNKYAKPDFVSYCADDLPNRYVSKTKLPVLAWTVSCNEKAERLCTVANNIIFERFIPREY